MIRIGAIKNVLSLGAVISLTVSFVACTDGFKTLSGFADNNSQENPPSSQPGTPPPPPGPFLEPYENPEQAKRDPQGMYPLGQRMPVSAYSTNNPQRRAMAAAGFTADGPHYHGAGTEADKYSLKWSLAKSLGMKGYYRLRVGGDQYRDFKTSKGKELITRQLTNHIEYVLSTPELNEFIDSWYGYEEEVLDRSYQGPGRVSLADQRAYHKYVHSLIVKLDTERKRPYYVSERRDSSRANMAGNSCFQDGVMKQDALIEDSGYTDDINVRGIMRHWAIEIVGVAAEADEKCPSYTGYPRAAIATLSSAQDPTDPANRNAAWLTKMITYDVYTQLAMGVDGFNVFSFGWNSHETAKLQQKVYAEILGGMIKAGLGKVFLWGDDRTDVDMAITSGPETFDWKFYSKPMTGPSIDMRNIQYGSHRYILLVNNSKEKVTASLSGFPGDLKMQELLSGQSTDLGTSFSVSINPLGVKMYKVSE